MCELEIKVTKDGHFDTYLKEGIRSRKAGRIPVNLLIPEENA
jgi:hypothetical protein